MHRQINFDIEILIEEYTPYVCKVIDNAVGPGLSAEGKEEVISDTFYLLWKNQDKVKTNLKAYLAKIAKNCAYHKLKTIEYTCELVKENTSEYFQDSLDESLIIKEKLSKLDQGEKSLLNLYYVKGYKIKEIARIQGKNPGSIKVSLYRIRKKLKEI